MDSLAKQALQDAGQRSLTVQDYEKNKTKQKTPKNPKKPARAKRLLEQLVTDKDRKVLINPDERWKE